MDNVLVTDTDHVVVLMTAAESEAPRLVNLLVAHRKAACVNVINGLKSTYWWQGNIESADESLLIIKTRASLLEELVRLIKENHSYQVPEIIALPIVAGNREYLGWIDSVTA